MSEEIGYFALSDTPRWKLSAQDDELLRKLHTVVLNWLWSANEGKLVAAMGHILEALEALIEHGSTPGSGECGIYLKPAGKDGFGAHFSVSPSALEFGLTEFVWMGVQGHDHGSILDAEGRPYRLEFTPKGSFDAARFEQWIEFAEAAAPKSFDDCGSVAEASWY